MDLKSLLDCLAINQNKHSHLKNNKIPIILAKKRNEKSCLTKKIQIMLSKNKKFKIMFSKTKNSKSCSIKERNSESCLTKIKIRNPV
jgi:hypothetical protein